MIVDPETLTNDIAASLHTQARRLDDEHATRGIDSLNELAIQEIIRRGLADGGQHVLAEQRYPEQARHRRRSQGERCDIVLTPTAGELIDPLQADTLFAGRGVDPGDACWIEVKTTGQFHVVDGEVRPNKTYSTLLLTDVMQDARKLASDPGILHAALLVVLFTVDRPTADHDVDAWYRRAITAGIPVSRPWHVSFEISDRHGNGCCTVFIAEVHHQ